MEAGMEDAYEEKIQLKEMGLEKLKVTEAETEACTAMSMKDECNKEI